MGIRNPFCSNNLRGWTPYCRVPIQEVLPMSHWAGGGAPEEILTIGAILVSLVAANSTENVRSAHVSDLCTSIHLHSCMCTYWTSIYHRVHKLPNVMQCNVITCNVM